MNPAHLLTITAATMLTAGLPQGIEENFFKAEPKALAAACADKAWVIDHQSGRFFAEYGRAYLGAGQRARAEDAFRRAAVVGTKDAETFRLIATAWLAFGCKPEALAAFDTMQKAEPTAAGVFAKAACQLLEAGFVEESEKLMDKAWKLNPKAWSSAADFGKAALRMRKLEMAAQWFQRAIEIRPRDERLWTDLALAYGAAASAATSSISQH